MTWWQAADVTLFHWINSTMSNPVFDALLPWCREKWFWAPLYLFLAAFAWNNYGIKKGWIFIAGLVLAVGLADFTSSSLIKKNVRRLRPCNDLALKDEVRLRVPCGSGYSFTSSHAANHFAVAIYAGSLLTASFPWARLALLIWASLIAFSQVYVGVHYPGDVLGGGLVGAFMGWWTVQTFRRRRLFV